jgi:hypothetical protein
VDYRSGAEGFPIGYIPHYDQSLLPLDRRSRTRLVRQQFPERIIDPALQRAFDNPFPAIISLQNQLISLLCARQIWYIRRKIRNLDELIFLSFEYQASSYHSLFD